MRRPDPARQARCPKPAVPSPLSLRSILAEWADATGDHLLIRIPPEVEGDLPLLGNRSLRREPAMLINEVMTRTVRTITPDESIGQAAKMMAEIDAGAIPVGENDRLVGMITDRDIAIRAI